MVVAVNGFSESGKLPVFCQIFLWFAMLLKVKELVCVECPFEKKISHVFIVNLGHLHRFRLRGEAIMHGCQWVWLLVLCPTEAHIHVRRSAFSVTHDITPISLIRHANVVIAHFWGCCQYFNKNFFTNFVTRSIFTIIRFFHTVLLSWTNIKNKTT